MPLSVIILAAGQGTRMRSRLPKVLQPLAGRPMLAHVIDCARELEPDDLCVVYGWGGDAVRERCDGPGIRWALQAEQLGTGHAVAQAMPGTPRENLVLVLCGDVPLVRAETLRRLVDACAGPETGPKTGSEAGHETGDTAGVLTVELGDPTGYGRIVRGGDGAVLRIVEEKDANESQRLITEINTGVIACPAGRLAVWLEALSANNAQGEYYLTDVIESAVEAGVPVAGVKATGWEEVMGINDKRQLAAAERALQRERVDALLDAGVTIADPARVDVRGSLECGSDVFIDVNAVFEGEVVLGDGVHIGPNAVIRDTRLGAGTVVHANSVLDAAETGERCQVGPFARLRPGARLADRAKVGNFVEVKQAEIGEGSKVNHLTYIGDATIGRDVNVGAGTITCNYDGANKHRTVIGDEAFIGSGVELVAPVEVGAGATIGAGSTISRLAPEGKLTLERAPQKTVDDWQRPRKKTGA